VVSSDGAAPSRTILEKGPAIRLNLGIRGVGAIRYKADRFILGENAAGTSFAKDMIPGTIANSAAGKLAGKVLTKLSTVKLAYDAVTYAGAAVACYASQN